MKEQVKQFIIREIETLSEMFPYVSFKYGFDKVGKQHLVEVEPETEYRNEKFMEKEFDVVDEFIARFPMEEILFISNNKYINIENIVYVKESRVPVKSNAIVIAELVGCVSLIQAPLNLAGYIASPSQSDQLKIVNILLQNENNDNFKLNELLLGIGESNIAMAA